MASPSGLGAICGAGQVTAVVSATPGAAETPSAPMPLTPAVLAAWLRLAAAPGVPARALDALLATQHDIEILFELPQAALAAIVGKAAARALLAPVTPTLARQIEATHAWLDTPGHRLLTRRDPCYPPRLRELHDAPPVLYLRGQIACLHAPAVAVVGSRAATPQGLADANWFAQQLAQAGFTIVSGLARGIDGAAHQGARAGRGSTVAVLGTGADQIYPACHRHLAEEIAAEGALLTEWPLGTPARAAHFPQRNRLIAGLSRGVLVIEAALRSGSLITARLANEMGREVFAVPGSIHAPLSHGCHALIRDGAKLVETVGDILEEFGLAVAPDPAREAASRQQRIASAARRPGDRSAEHRSMPTASARAITPLPRLSPDAQRLLEALGHAPVPLDILDSRTGLGPARLHELLLELELGGRIAALPGGRFARLASHDEAPATGSTGRQRVLQSLAPSDFPGSD